MRILFAALLIIAITPTATAQPRRMFAIAHEFHVSERGKETIKTLKEMSKAELRTIVTAGCAALANKCAKLAGQIQTAATVPGMVIAEGENVYITGRVLKQQDDKWWGIYDAPKGYTPCRAALGKASLTAGSVFDATIAKSNPHQGAVVSGSDTDRNARQAQLRACIFLGALRSGRDRRSIRLYAGRI